MWIIEVYDTQPGFEGKAEIGPFFSQAEAIEAFEKEKQAIETTYINPDYVRLYVRQVQ